MGRVTISCTPDITADISLNGTDQSFVHLGRVRDSHRKQHRVDFDADENFVVVEFGKRGSGKSFGMGAALEAFATVSSESTLARHHGRRRGILLLDPLDVHWTAIYALHKGVTTEMDEQYELLKRWPEIEVTPIDVRVYMPAGKELPGDPPEFHRFQLPVADLTAEDLALLYGTNLFSEPAGMLLLEAYEKVTRLGYEISGTRYEPILAFGLQDLIQALADDELTAAFHEATRRAVRQRLRTWLSDPLFQSQIGTPIRELIYEGRLAIICMNRLSEIMRSVVTGVLVRKIKAERIVASQVERRRAFDPDAPADDSEHLPRAILAIDEAQMILPAGAASGPARQAVESYILEGRAFGLSIWLATQRPKGAISSKAVSQIDLMICHRLSMADDIKAARELLQAAEPTKMRVNGRDVDFAGLIRALEIGMALVSSESAPRTFVMEMRPRVVAHGGRAF